jgi:hypothetical protein
MLVLLRGGMSVTNEARKYGRNIIYGHKSKAIPVTGHGGL